MGDRRFRDMLLAALKTEGICAIGISELRNAVEIANREKLFDQIVTVSGSCVGAESTAEKLSGVIAEERILIILADVPEVVDLHSIVALLQQLRDTSRILLTSRFARVFGELGAYRIASGEGSQTVEVWLVLREKLGSIRFNPAAANTTPVDNTQLSIEGEESSPYIDFSQLNISEPENSLPAECKLTQGRVVGTASKGKGRLEDATMSQSVELSEPDNSIPTEGEPSSQRNDDSGEDKHHFVHLSLPSSNKYQSTSDMKKIMNEEAMGGAKASEGKEVEINHLENVEIYLGCDDYAGSRIGELKGMNLQGSLYIANLENVTTKEEAAEACLCNKKGLTEVQLQWNVLGHEKNPDQEEVLESLQPPLGIKELQMFDYSGGVLPSWLSSTSFSELVTVSLCCCRFLDSLPSLGQLPSLKFLEIIQNDEIVEINASFCRKLGNQPRKSFPKLEKLSFSLMSKLEKMTGWENGDFPCLSELAIAYCPKLVGLPNLSHLNSLLRLKICDCPELSCFPKGGLPATLRSLSIRNCAKLDERLCDERCKDWSVFAHVPIVSIRSEGIIILNRRE